MHGIILLTRHIIVDVNQQGHLWMLEAQVGCTVTILQAKLINQLKYAGDFDVYLKREVSISPCDHLKLLISNEQITNMLLYEYELIYTLFYSISNYNSQ